MAQSIEGTCLTCGNVFPQVNSKKYCTEKCRNKARAERYKQRAALIEKLCTVCQRNFKYDPKSHPERGERMFCGRSCASKHYIQNGTYDTWRLRSDPKLGEERACAVCPNMVYYTQGQIEKGYRRVCSKVCYRKLMSEMFSNGKGPMCGKKLTHEQKHKHQATLLAKYGVTNAFMLAKNRSIVSKPQRWLFEELNKTYDCKLETWVTSLQCHADILFVEHKLIVEFMGDYWHCNPATYDENYFNQKKRLLAKDIWKLDEARRNKIVRRGYNLIEVWESEYNANRAATLDDLKSKINEHIEKTKNTLHLRSSVKC